MILKVKDQLETLHQQINNGSTGSPAELAQLMGFSERTIKRYIAQLRQMGAEISYCYQRNTYYYTTPVTFWFGYGPVIANDDNSVGNGEGE
jgi:biotin operon repressor